MFSKVAWVFATMCAALFITTVYTTNYCTICSGHIACNKTSGLQSTCPAGASIVPMTPSLKGFILHLHNDYRNSIANGSVSPFATASRMATVQWDNELEIVASYNANRCTFAHDTCRKTDKFPWAGQNICLIWTGGPNITDIPAAINGMIDAWYYEYRNTNTSQINSFDVPSDGSMNGHFTQMVNQKVTHVGCAAVLYSDATNRNIYMVCNYAFPNFYHYPVYATGSVGSGCTTGCNPEYPALCNPCENISVQP